MKNDPHLQSGYPENSDVCTAFKLGSRLEVQQEGGRQLL